MVSSADSARSCPALTEARRLATWVGKGRRVTPKGFLRPADVPAALEAVGHRDEVLSLATLRRWDPDAGIVTQLR